MRPVSANDETVPAGRVGRLRLLLITLPVLLGTAAPSGLHAGGPADHVRVANPKIDERDVAIDMFDHDPSLLAGRAGQTILADKGYVSAEFERILNERGVEVVRPARKDERPRRGARQLKSLRQIIESVNDTLKGQLSLEDHGGHSPQGVTVRILQRLLALTAAIWHNHHTRQPVLRSINAYDH